MQIVINIPKNVYDMLQQFPDDQLHIENAIKYGVPFNSVIEDIKADIKMAIDEDRTLCRVFALELALDIIDKHIGRK